INIHDDYSLIDLPVGMPRETFKALRKVWVAGQRLEIERLDEKHKSRQKSRKKKGQHAKRKNRKK
ncbi:MAG: DbpA RNA binding domain-containing protein, partial [Gammaproteobacteria bacterium]|nr:DbpA RNA binding domain-containing protein [Gammaproteobacteria bacterium]